VVAVGLVLEAEGVAEGVTEAEVEPRRFHRLFGQAIPK